MIERIGDRNKNLQSWYVSTFQLCKGVALDEIEKRGLGVHDVWETSALHGPKRSVDMTPISKKGVCHDKDTACKLCI